MRIHRLGEHATDKLIGMTVSRRRHRNAALEVQGAPSTPAFLQETHTFRNGEITRRSVDEPIRAKLDLVLQGKSILDCVVPEAAYLEEFRVSKDEKIARCFMWRILLSNEQATANQDYRGL